VNSFVETGTFLDRILTRTALDVEDRKRRTGLGELERRSGLRPALVSLREALATPALSVIAEVKRASPSKGRFAVEIDVEELASSYVRGGAAAISVLTDEPFFAGSLADLECVSGLAHRDGRRVPVLRKDFILDEYQIDEALAYGADAILLIVAALNDERLRGLLRAATERGLDALVEVRDEEEMMRAAESGAKLIGINNRDLRTFEVDLDVTERLAPLAPPGTIMVGESGVHSGADARRMAMAGVHAVLVGESLILAGDRRAAMSALLEAGATGSRPSR